MKQLYYLILFISLFSITTAYAQTYDAKLIELYFANDGSPEAFIKAESGFYFTAIDPRHGRELWFSDGRIENTYMVKDILEGDRSSNVQPQVVLGDLLFFTAEHDWFSDRQLWVSDGTEEGTYKIKDISAQEMFAYNGKVYFHGKSEAEGGELWVSDGTAEGTKILKDIREGAQSSNPNRIFEFNGFMFFTADDGNSGRELWKSDGTPEGTFLLKDINPNHGALYGANSFLEYNGNFFFMADDGQNGYELFKSDGTKEGTKMLKNINPNGSAIYGLQATVNENGIFFFADDGENGYELWKSDGTAEGTVMVKNLYPEGDSLTPHYPAGLIISLDNIVYFVADDGTSESQLWKTDGTEEGTTNVISSYDNSDLSRINNLKVINGKIYFVANGDNLLRSRIWTSDGTEEGTFPLSEVDITTNLSSFRFELFGYENKVYFVANSEVYGHELWVTDGTKEGTDLFKDFNHRWGSMAQNFNEINGLLYFAARKFSDGNQLFVSNGTAEGTKMVKNINPSGYNSLDEESETIVMNNELFFSASDGVHGFELWKSDGTESGTVMVKDIREGSKGSMYNEKYYPTFSVIGDKLFFLADDGVHGWELWVSDGTSQGTNLVKDVYPGVHSSGAAQVVSLNNSVFFKGKGLNGSAIFKTDGTPGGTVKIKDLHDIRKVRVVNNRLIIVAETSDTTYGPHDIWTSDGTTEGTVHLKSFGDGIDSDIRFMTTLEDELYFVAKNPESFKKAVYKTNGTSEGTELLYEGIIDIDIIRTCGAYVYFVVEKDNSYGGVELWRTAGSAETTMRVSNTEEGVYNYVESLTCFQDEIYFIDAYNNQEIWRVNKNSGDTNKLSYTIDGEAPSEELLMSRLYGTKNVLYFIGSTPESGDELHAIQNGPLAALPVDNTPEISISTDIFSVKINNETCAGKNNGSLFIESSEEHSFIASVNGDSFNFSKELLVEDLPADHYAVCITMESESDFKQCFEFTVQPGGTMEGKMQSRKTSKGTLVNVNVEKGTAPFSATLDGKIIGSYNAKNFTILAEKEGKLEIISSKSCEGKMALDIESINSIVAFPNPSSTYLNIAIPDTHLNEIPVWVYNGSGQLISSKVYTLKDNILTIDVQNYSPGIYYAVFKSETPHTIKFYKK